MAGAVNGNRRGTAAVSTAMTNPSPSAASSVHLTLERVQSIFRQGQQSGVASQETRGKRQRNMTPDSEERDEEMRRAVRRAEELESQLAQQKTETVAWHAMSMEQHKAISCLNARLQRAVAALEEERAKAEEGSGETAGDDAESAHVDPERKRLRGLAGVCRECEERVATVVLLPCRHLCLCSDCNEEVAPVPCHVCHSIRTGFLHVFLS